MGTPPDFWRDVPIWARTIFLLGAPTVAAGFLIYTLTNSVTADLHAMREQLATHAVNAEANAVRISEMTNLQQLKLDILIRISTQQCVNAAVDVLQRRQCLEAAAR